MAHRTPNLLFFRINELNRETLIRFVHHQANVKQTPMQ